MDEQNKNNEPSTPPVEEKKDEKPAGKYIRLKPFSFIMLIMLLILGTAAITIFALTFGEKKVVEVRTPSHPEFQQLFDVYDELNDSYYKDLETDKLVQGALNGMISSLDDPYSDFMTGEDAESFNNSISSSFEGIGAEIQEKDGQIIVVSPIKNSPAEKAGILPNDVIKKVDGKSIDGKTANEAVQLIRGEKGTKVKLEIQRDGSTKLQKMTLTRAEIPLETVYGKMQKGKIAHIQITSFSEDTYEELLTQLDKMEKKGMKGLVLDVRQNPGGRLDTAIDIASLFVKNGEPIMQIENRDGEKQTINAKSGRKVSVPVTMLIDGGSASASEILAAALNEESDVQLIGEKSFGKGTVQTVEDLSDGSTLKYTVSKWLTPEGNWIHEKGVKPTIKVAYPSYASLPYVDPAKKLKEGTLSDDVKSIEKMLQALDYAPGKADGLYDATTVAAVNAFQLENDLEQTGVVTGETTTKIMEQLREKIQDEDPQLKKANDAIKKQLN